MRRHIALLLVLGLMFSAYGCTPPADGDTNGMEITNEQSTERVVDSEGTVKSLESDGQINEGQKDNENKSTAEIERLPVTLYYQDEDGYLIPVTRRIVKQVGIARAALNCLIDSSSNREELEYFGLYPVLPSGTEILGINIKEGTAIVDFNEKFLEYEDSIAERNIICSVVYTLTEFNTIDGVKILVNGRNMGKLKYNTDISEVLNRKNVYINTGGVNVRDGLEKSDIYVFKIVRDSYVYALPVSKVHSKTAEGEKPKKLIELLAEELDDEKLYSEIPQGIKLIESKISNKLLTLDFDGNSLDYGGSYREEGMLKQILYSMSQLEGVEKVRILVNGKTAELPEGTDISKDIALPKAINDFIDK